MQQERYAPTNLLDAIHAHNDLVHSVTRRLDSIANSMRNLGLMEELATELYTVADRLNESANSVRDAHGLAVSDNLHHSEAMAGLLLQATLKGVLSPASGGTRS